MRYARWVVAVAAMAAGCGDNLPAKPDSGRVQVDAGRSPVSRGRYIMNTLGACTFCHTPLNPDGSRDLTKLFAGVDCFIDIDPADPNGGCLASRNLTNHETGLKNRTDQQIKDAFTKGMRTDGKILSPVMPYWVFHNMTEDDQDAIVAYLRTVPGIDHQVAANQPPWNLINDGVTQVCDMLGTQGTTPCKADFIDPTTIPMPAAGFADQASALRGRYLSSMVGLCIDCHTPELAHVPVNNPIPPFFPRPIDATKFYSGGRPFFSADLGLPSPPYPAFPNPIFTRNLTPHATGLMSWTVPQIKSAIALGKDRDGNAVCAGTHGSLVSPYAALDEGDLDDIANYIASLSPVDHDTGTNCAGPPVP
jgi:cytochrome c553